MCVCVCDSVCVRAPVTTLAATSYAENKVSLGFLWHFQDMHWVALVENALFKSFVTLILLTSAFFAAS